jgi:hypothetical protein
MSPSQPPRDPSEDLGYEVIDDPGYEVVDTPPKPAKAIPTAKLLPAKLTPAARATPRPAADPGFEVVEGPVRSKPKVRVVRDAEAVEESRPKSKAIRVHAVEDEEDDDRPRKKTRRKGAAAAAPEDKESSALAEWAGPVFMMVVGLILGVVGTAGLARQPDSLMNPTAAAVGMVIYQFVTIPILVVGLMVIGSLFGIEYGTFVHAVRSLAAMGFLVGGLTNFLDWLGLPFFASQPIIFFIGLGLFMTLLRLDVWEAVVTMIGTNMIMFVFNIVAFILLLAVLASGMDKGNLDDGPSPKDKQGQMDDADFDPEADPWGPDDEGE